MVRRGELLRGQSRMKQGDELWSSCAGSNSPVAQVLTTIVALV